MQQGDSGLAGLWAKTTEGLHLEHDWTVAGVDSSDLDLYTASVASPRWMRASALEEKSKWAQTSFYKG